VRLIRNRSFLIKVSFDDRPITGYAAVAPRIAFDGVFLIPSTEVIARVIAEVFLKLVGPLLLNSLHDDSVNSLARDYMDIPLPGLQNC
jgi:hypothetical protein